MENNINYSINTFIEKISLKYGIEKDELQILWNTDDIPTDIFIQMINEQKEKIYEKIANINIWLNYNQITLET